MRYKALKDFKYYVEAISFALEEFYFIFEIKKESILEFPYHDTTKRLIALDCKDLWIAKSSISFIEKLLELNLIKLVEKKE